MSGRRARAGPVIPVPPPVPPRGAVAIPDAEAQDLETLSNEYDVNYHMDPFEKKIDSKNKFWMTAAENFCQLTIPKRWARGNGYTVDTMTVYFTSASMLNSNFREKWFRQVIRSPEHNNNNWVIVDGWYEFSSFHQVRKNWRLLFTPIADRGPKYLLVQRVINKDRLHPVDI